MWTYRGNVPIKKRRCSSWVHVLLSDLLMYRDTQWVQAWLRLQVYCWLWVRSSVTVLTVYPRWEILSIGMASSFLYSPYARHSQEVWYTITLYWMWIFFVSKCCFWCEVIHRNLRKSIVGVALYNSDRIECVCWNFGVDQAFPIAIPHLNHCVKKNSNTI